MDFRQTWTARILSLIILSIFLWTFGGVYDIAFAAKSGKLTADSSQPKSKAEHVEKKFEKAIEDIDDLIDQVGKAESRKARKLKKKQLKAKKKEIEAHDRELRKKFKETEEKIRDLPDVIKQRHRDFIKKYEENLKELKANIDDIDRAVDEIAVKNKVEKAKRHFKKIKKKKKHVPLDPNKLPHRSAEKRTLKKPRTKPEEFEKEFSPQGTQRAQRKNMIQDAEVRIQEKDTPLLVAANGPLTGLMESPLPASNLGRPLINDDLLSVDSTLNIASEPSVVLLAAAQPPTAYDLSETIEVQFTSEIQQLAADLDNNPVKIFNYVRNNFEYEPYYGSLKGAAQTLLEKAGNDFDQASLLIALLRASNIPAHYVYGTIELPIDKFMNWVGGVTDINTAVQILATAGVPGQTITEGGKIKYVQFEHAWVEAYVPYGNYRGSMRDDTIKTWIQMDPSFKQYYERDRGMDLYSAMNVNGEQFLIDYINDTSVLPVPLELQAQFADYIISPYQYFSKKLKDYLETNVPNYDLATVLGDIEGYIPNNFIIQKAYPFLPGSLPYNTISIGNVFSSISDNKRHKITINLRTEDTLYTSGSSDFTISLSTIEIVNHRVTLSYKPATQNDVNLVTNYGGILYVPPHLINLKAVLKIDGQDIANGNPIGLGYDQQLTITFSGPNQKTDVIINKIIVGNYASLVIVPGNVRAEYSGLRMEKFRSNLDLVPLRTVNVDDVYGEMFYNIGLSYFGQLFFQESIFAQAFQVLMFRQPSEAIVSHEVSVEYLFDIPSSVSVGGISIDVDRDKYLTLALDGNKSRTKDFMIASGVASSVLENRIIELIYNAPSVSAVKIMKLSSAQGIPIYTLDKSNISQLFPQLQVSQTVLSNVQNAINAGKKVIVPQSNIQYLNWNGTGYIVLDPVTGAGFYMISTQHAGGYSAVNYEGEYPEEGFDSFDAVYARLCPEERNMVLWWAAEWLGTPYRWGGKVPGRDCNPKELDSSDGFDCSGFVGWVFKEAGYPKLFWFPGKPQTKKYECWGISAEWQYNMTADTSYPLIGDLVFFYGSVKKVLGIHHVGIIWGEDLMINAFRTDEFVQIDPFNRVSWAQELYFGTVFDDTCNIYD
jgi:cell wall-associated NlpC family hydrolase